MISKYVPMSKINLDSKYHLSYACATDNFSIFRCTSIQGTKTVKVFTFESRYYQEDGSPLSSQVYNLLMADYAKSWGCRYFVK